MIFKNIFSALENLGLGAQKRSLHIQFSNPALNTEVFLQRIEGQHQINGGLQAELICFSTNAYLPLKQFIGVQVAVDQVTDRGQLFRTTGIITQAAQGQSDGALTAYKLTLEDPTSLWTKRRNSRVFMNKSVREVTEILFKEWQDKSPLFAASLNLDLTGLSQNGDVRPFIMQSNELDLSFLQRLWKSEGISYLIDEAQQTVSSFMASIEAQKLRLIDDQAQYKSLSRGNIRYHRSNATEKQDSIVSFIAQRSLQPTAVHVQRWQADSLSQEEGAGSVLSKHQHSGNQDNVSLSLEQAWHISPAWMQDLNGEDQATASSNQQIEKLNENLSKYYDAQAKQFIAKSTVRDAQVGYWFEFNEHPEIDLHGGSDKQFLILSKHFYNQNNLPKDLSQQIQQLLQQSNWLKAEQQLGDERQANELVLQRRTIPVVPEYHLLKDRPTTHPQRAKVVGPEGEEIHVDEWGRIKVRFLFTRSEDHAHDSGAGANDNDTDSAWVDVLTPWAGEGYGARFLPRIGEIVVIDFFDGNIDRPFVVGRIHEAERSPTKFDIKGQLPDTKKLSGIRSKEVAGEGFGQLRFDDTTEQISTQLQSSHGATQLNLGNLSHPKEQAESEGRGEGFELRTDQWGAVRAGNGLLLTTHKQDNAEGSHLDANEAKSQLESNLSSAKALSEVAKNQQTDPLTVIDSLSTLLKGLELTKILAISNIVNQFKDGLTSSPLNVLQNLGGFVDQIGSIQGDVQGVIQQFNNTFSDVKETINGFENFVTSVGLQADNFKDQFTQLTQGFASNPYQALGQVKDLFSDVQQAVQQVQNIGGILQSSLSNPLSSFSNLQGFMSSLAENAKNDPKSEAEFKIFQDAMMVLSAPNSIALSTNEDLYLSADGKISQMAGESINISTQKSFIAHAQDKISLFAAQEGLRAYAGKGKVEIQAQADGADLIARKKVQMISTEDVIEITAAKKIVLVAGGSKIEISSAGIFPTTAGKFESKAGQHLFKGGGKVNFNVPYLPNTDIYSHQFTLKNKFGKIMKNTKYVLEASNGKQIRGITDNDGKTRRIYTSEKEKFSIDVEM